jgi:hypothetical protein
MAAGILFAGVRQDSANCVATRRFQGKAALPRTHSKTLCVFQALLANASRHGLRARERRLLARATRQFGIWNAMTIRIKINRRM